MNVDHCAWFLVTMHQKLFFFYQRIQCKFCETRYCRQSLCHDEKDNNLFGDLIVRTTHLILLYVCFYFIVGTGWSVEIEILSTLGNFP